MSRPRTERNGPRIVDPMPSHPVHPPEWIDSAPIVVDQSVVIHAPPSAVWAEIADHTSWPEWFTALDRVEPGPTSTGVGGTRRVIASRLALDEEFTAWDENEHFAFAVTASKLPILERDRRVRTARTGRRRHGMQGHVPPGCAGSQGVRLGDEGRLVESGQGRPRGAEAAQGARRERNRLRSVERRLAAGTRGGTH